MKTIGYILYCIAMCFAHQVVRFDDWGNRKVVSRVKKVIKPLDHRYLD